ncbi:MAG: sigma-70 family RNA polymerase sigma factor [Acidobacteriales bacterium]|nr:sigma-70 family RNA polymerase sigma factor [Terriglobales bacterium]
MIGSNAMNGVVRQLRRDCLLRDQPAATDGELLDRYVAGRQEAAFEMLLRRHGPMVLGVCRRILGNEADAEDAFQATFLVFVRKAASIRKKRSVGSWLYGVAHNTALKAKAMNRKRSQKENEVQRPLQPPRAEAAWRETQALLDAELSQLPESCRAALVLCELQGKTIKEAAAHLGWPQGTVATRLRRGRCKRCCRRQRS